MTTTADILVETLIDWGVEVVFGLPGDGINGIMEALRTRQDEIRFIQVRHEEAAAFMACGYAKFTGKLGVLPRHLGPGRHPPAQRPLRRQAGRAAGAGHHRACTTTTSIDTHAQQDVDLDRSSTDVAVYNTRVMGPAHVENVADLACRTALACRGVAHITSPSTCRTAGRRRPALEAQRARAHARRCAAGAARCPPTSDAATRAADDAQRRPARSRSWPAGARSARPTSWSRSPRLLGAPIIKALLGKAACPTTARYTTGGIGLLGTAPVAGGAGGVRHAADGRARRFPYIEF